MDTICGISQIHVEPRTKWVYVTNESPMSHRWMGHVRNMNESCHVWKMDESYHTGNMNESWHAWHMNESCHTYISYIVSIWQINAEWRSSWGIHRWIIMSHIWMGRVTYGTWMSHVTYEIQMSHVTYETWIGHVMYEICLRHITHMKYEQVI